MPITGHFCLFWGYSIISNIIFYKTEEKKKALFLRGKRPSKKRVFWGKQLST